MFQRVSLAILNGNAFSILQSYRDLIVIDICPIILLVEYLVM